MHISKRGAAAAAASVMIAGCTVVVLAQASDAGAGSLGELTAEIRQLRFAIEQSARSQTQAHALGIFLSAQDRRVMMVSGRLESARREVTNFSQQTSTYTHQLAQIEEELAHTTDTQERAALADRSKEIKIEMTAVAAREQEARTRETEMLQAYQQEEARWNDLIGRLQQLIQH